MRSITILLAVLLAFSVSNAMADREVEYKPGGKRFDRVWKNFYKEPGHEPELDDPLIEAGKRMTSAICEAVIHPDMKRRRYAIGALGFIGDRRALPTLETILRNAKEKDYFRGDALKAIYQIDDKLGTTYARKFMKRNDYLNLIADAILRKATWLTEPTEEEHEEGEE
jgi:hypothetical protein